MQKRAALLMLLPAIGLFLLSFAIPMILVGRLSLFRSNYIVETYVGFENYREALIDGAFTRSLLNVGAYLFLICTPTVAISYFMASLIDDVGKRFQNIARFAIYIPTISAGLIIAIVWKWIFARDGLADWVFGVNVGWFSRVWPARVAVAVAVVTTAIGTYTIMLSAGMKSMSGELRDAARIDGASNRQYRKYIVFPHMVPMIALIALLSILGTIQMWETVYWLTGGGPAGYTATPIFDVYMTAFSYSKHGLAAAKSVVLIMLVISLVAVKRRIELLA